MSKSENPSGMTSETRHFGWLWMILVAGLAFGGGIYLAKTKKPPEISAAEKAPAKPLPSIESVQFFSSTNAVRLLSSPPTTPFVPASIALNIQQVPVGSTSYNGILIPGNWPPTNAYHPDRIMDLPYLRQPPELIDVSIGRQLFVDDFLIDLMTNVTRTYFQAEMHTNNPVLEPDREWEMGTGKSLAMPDSDGMWWDPTNHHFKMWYRAGRSNVTALAISTNGTNWSKPILGRVSGNNVVQPHQRQSSSVILDYWAKWKTEKYKMFRSAEEAGVMGLALHYSSDGTNWGSIVRWFGPAPLGSSAFYNPMRKVWVFNLADDVPPRKRRYWEMEDLMTGELWGDLRKTPVWVGADFMDKPLAQFNVAPELVQLEVTPYESLLVGMFTIWRGAFPEESGRPPHSELYLGYSRDGFHWFRPDRRPFVRLGANQSDWNWGDIRSVGGGLHILGRRLNFPITGKTRDPATGRLIGSMGIASLRRDGFASINAGATGGLLVTKPIKFTYAGYLFLNMKPNAPGGEIRVSIVSTNMNSLEVTNKETGKKSSFASDNCRPVTADSTLSSVHWGEIPNIGMLINRPIRLIFHIKNASLYSFWISKSARRGRSEGFAAGGGLHFSEGIDSIGNISYKNVDYLPLHLRPPKPSTTTNGVPIQPTPLLDPQTPATPPGK